MKSNELRIGNLIYQINRSGEVHLPIEIPMKVLQIGLFHSLILTNNVNPAQVTEYLNISNGDLSPIPINGEWLKKCGFQENTSFADFQLITNCFNIEFDISGELVDCYLEKNGIDILYVHQLQNLYFALTGEELTIKE